MERGGGDDMYKAMYSLLFNRITDALEQLNIGEARRTLIQAQCDSESLFSETEDKEPSAALQKD